MNETAEIYRKTIGMAQKVSMKNIIAVKFSAMANLDEMKALNQAENEFLMIYYKIDKNGLGHIELSQVINNNNFFFNFSHQFKLEKHLKEDKNIVYNEDNLKEFLAVVLNKNTETPKNELKISEIEWRTNVHAYYLFDKHKTNVFLMKKLNSLDSKYLNLLDAYAQRIISISQKAHENKVQF